jgi:predicted N-acyltransferase
MFDIQTHPTIANIPPAHWQQLNNTRPFSSRRWYQYLEQTFAADQPIYLILYKEETPTALAIYWVKADEPLPIPPSPIRTLAAAVIRRWPLITNHDPIVGGQSCLLLPDDPTLHTAALETINQHAQTHLKQHHGSFILHTYLEKAQCRWPGWPANFTVMDSEGPQTILHLNYPTFDDYLTWLRKNRKSTYKDYRRQSNRAADLGIEVTIENEVTDIEQALTLIQATHDNHGSMPHPNARPAMEHLSIAGGRWLAARQNGRLVGTGLLLGDNGGWVMAFLGLDYNVRYAYFQLIYAAIREAIESGGTYLVGGASTYNLKERLGFQKQCNPYVGFISRSRILGWIGRQLSDKAV